MAYHPAPIPDYPVPAGHKWCPRCRAARPTDDFARDRSKSDGLCASCKPCNRTRSAGWYSDNRERHISNVLGRQHRQERRPGTDE